MCVLGLKAENISCIWSTCYHSKALNIWTSVPRNRDNISEYYNISEYPEFCQFWQDDFRKWLCFEKYCQKLKVHGSLQGEECSGVLFARFHGTFGALCQGWFILAWNYKSYQCHRFLFLWSWSLSSLTIIFAAIGQVSSNWKCVHCRTNLQWDMSWCEPVPLCRRDAADTSSSVSAVQGKDFMLPWAPSALREFVNAVMFLTKYHIAWYCYMGGKTSDM